MLPLFFLLANFYQNAIGIFRMQGTNQFIVSPFFRFIRKELKS